MKIKILLLVCLGFLFFQSCMHADVKMIPLHIDNHQFTVELADTHEKQERGLMFRKEIPDDFGMLFTYDYEANHGFWMKNCFVHLDIIYLDRNKQVVDMYVNVPPCKAEPCISYTSKAPAQYVLELRANRSTEIGLKLGDTVFFILK